MTTELGLLVASIVPGIVHLIASSHLISWQRGYRWTAGKREEDVPPLRGVANRVDQATTNFLETFPFFAAAVLLTRVTDHHSSLTVIGAHLYFWGRIGYLLAAAARLRFASFRALLECSCNRGCAPSNRDSFRTSCQLKLLMNTVRFPDILTAFDTLESDARTHRTPKALARETLRAHPGFAKLLECDDLASLLQVTKTCLSPALQMTSMCWKASLRTEGLGALHFDAAASKRSAIDR